MGDLVTYRTMFTDSSRWAHFDFRAGDIVISTPPKSGTTWTQMLCALMIFDGPELPDLLDAISPWLDFRIRSEDEVFEVYGTQTHRRFIKTHTPLDGIPSRDDVVYVVVGRDPRDVAVSWENHVANMDLATLFAARVAATGDDDLHEFARSGDPDPDPAVRFREFIEADWDPSHLVTLASTVHHLSTGWERRSQPNVGLFHFLDYQRDLVGEMERLAALCAIDITRDRLGELAPEAGIERMRERADELVPNQAKTAHWHDPAAFFRDAGTGQWRTRTTERDRERYRQRVGELVDPDLAAWIHRGSVLTAD